MNKKEFKKYLSEERIEFKEENGIIKITAPGYVYLPFVTTLPSGVEFHNGGYVIYNNDNDKKHIGKPYMERFKAKKKGGGFIVFKRVSVDFKTQEGEKYETLWPIGTVLEHPRWKPQSGECGEGKFHACAKPGWCDVFRNKKDDRYIAILVEDIYEWTNSPQYPQKIAFRKATVLHECDRNGKKI